MHKIFLLDIRVYSICLPRFSFHKLFQRHILLFSFMSQFHSYLEFFIFLFFYNSCILFVYIFLARSSCFQKCLDLLIHAGEFCVMVWWKNQFAFFSPNLFFSSVRMSSGFYCIFYSIQTHHVDLLLCFFYLFLFGVSGHIAPFPLSFRNAFTIFTSGMYCWRFHELDLRQS